jgi:hypothetical protein
MRLMHSKVLASCLLAVSSSLTPSHLMNSKTVRIYEIILIMLSKAVFMRLFGIGEFRQR